MAFPPFGNPQGLDSNELLGTVSSALNNRSKGRISFNGKNATIDFLHQADFIKVWSSHPCLSLCIGWIFGNVGIEKLTKSIWPYLLKLCTNSVLSQTCDQVGILSPAFSSFFPSSYHFKWLASMYKLFIKPFWVSFNVFKLQMFVLKMWFNSNLLAIITKTIIHQPSIFRNRVILYLVPQVKFISTKKERHFNIIFSQSFTKFIQYNNYLPLSSNTDTQPPWKIGRVKKTYHLPTYPK